MKMFLIGCLLCFASFAQAESGCTGKVLANKSAKCWKDEWRMAFLEVMREKGGELLNITPGQIILGGEGEYGGTSMSQHCKELGEPSKNYLIPLYYLTLAENICSKESGNNSSVDAPETAASGVLARGLCQLAAKPMEGYRKNGCTIKSDKKGAPGSVYNEEDSARCMAAMIIQLVGKDKVIGEGKRDSGGKGLSRYFQPMQTNEVTMKSGKKVNNMANRKDILAATGQACSNQFRDMGFSEKVRSAAYAASNKAEYSGGRAPASR